MSRAGRVALAGAASGAIYAATYVLQHAMAPGQDHGPGLAWLSGLYICATIAIVLLYWTVVALASSESADRGTRVLAVAFPIAFNLALLLGQPHFSIDVYSYVAHGYQARVGQNPYAQPVRDLTASPFGAELERRGWIAVHGVSPYGPLWTAIEAGVGRAAADIAIDVRLFKAVVVASSLGSGLLIWLILGEVRPEWRWRGTLLYLWNPVAIVEFAGEGHNDALMIVFMLLSVWLWLRAKPGASLVAAAAGALVKISSVMLLPLQLAHGWRTYAERRRLLIGVALGAIVGTALAALAFAPFWIGPATFDGLRAHSRPGLLASTPGVFYWYLIHYHSEEASSRLLAVAMTGAFAGYVAIAALNVRDHSTFLEACGRVAIAYLILAPGYWAWYAAMPVALLALAPRERAALAIVALTLGSRLAAPIDVMRLNGLATWNEAVIATTVAGIWAPAMCIGAAGLWRMWTWQPAWRRHRLPTLGRV